MGGTASPATILRHSADGKPRLAVRFAARLLGVIAIIVIAVTITGSRTKQGKHDELAGGTQVVKG